MPETLKRLGAGKPASATPLALAVIDTNRSASVILHCCNQAASVDTIRVAHIDGAIGALAAEDYLFYDFPVEPNGVVDLSGLAMEAGHTLWVYSTNGNISFVAWAIEVA